MKGIYKLQLYNFTIYVYTYAESYFSTFMDSPMFDPCQSPNTTHNSHYH